MVWLTARVSLCACVVMWFTTCVYKRVLFILCGCVCMCVCCCAGVCVSVCMYVCVLLCRHSYPEQLKGATRVMCLAQGYIDFSPSQFNDLNQKSFGSWPKALNH